MQVRPHTHAPTQVGVVGSGPNGLAAAITMAHAGFQTELHEAQRTPGGACRTLPLTLPGFLHDFGAAVFPMAAGSPFFRELRLEDHGLSWLHHPAPLAHALPDGTAVLLEHNLDEACSELGPDGAAWRALVAPLSEQWDRFSPELLRPLQHVPRHPLFLARFGAAAALPARLLASMLFRSERTRALFAGLAAHSFLSLDAPFSSSIALVLAAAAHAVGWPIAAGGAGSITQALLGVFAAQGGRVFTAKPVVSADVFGDDAIVFCDTRPRQMVALSGDRLPPRYRRTLNRFRPGPGAFKIDYALSEPIPWAAAACRRASTVHAGGTLGEITRAERTTLRGSMPEQPFLLVAQPSLVDASRAPAGKHTAWVYCHVPYGWEGDATPQIEAQLERFAPGFRECVLARKVSPPHALAALDGNLVGGDISGGAMDIVQLLLRPTFATYATPDPHLYLCSSSTPPGGGVHGMCGFHAAQAALQRW